MYEDLTIIRLHAVHGNKWSTIASHLHGRTDNEIKNHWNTKLKKRLLLLGIDPVTHMSLPTADMLSDFMVPSSTAKTARLNKALVEAQLGRHARDYVNITHYLSAGSPDHHYLSPLSQLMKLLGAYNNHPSESLSSISTDQFIQPDALRWGNSSSKNQINQGLISWWMNDSTKDIAFSQEPIQFFDLENNSEGNILPISTDQGNEHGTASSLIEDQRSAFDAEIVDWNSMPILMPSGNLDENDHLHYYGDMQSPSTISANFLNSGSEIPENSTQHEDGPLGTPMRISDIMSPPAERGDLLEDERNYWVNLFNSIDNNPILSLPIP